MIRARIPLVIKIARPGKGLVLALGGGGARGFAHLGVLRVFEEEEIPVTGIVGTSMGAIVGGLVARLGSAKEAILDLESYVRSPEFQGIPFERLDPDPYGAGHVLAALGRRIRDSFIIGVGVHRTSTTEERFRDAPVLALFGDSTIESFRIPFSCVAVDLMDGQPVVFDRGSAYEGIRASSSIIGVFPPIRDDGRWLVDGDCCEPVPVPAARERFGGPVVAVPVPPHLDAVPKQVTVMAVLVRQSRILDRNLTALQARTADLSIEPDVGKLYWNEFQEISQAIEAGAVAAKNSLPRIKELARRTSRRWTSWLGGGQGR